MFRSQVSIEHSDQNLPDFSALCLMFPGQGLIVPESYSQYFDIPIVREVFQEADELATLKNLPPISGLIFKNRGQGSATLDTQSDAKQALLKNLFQLTIGTALFRYLIQSGRSPKALTAHSFGEYTALHCTGVIDFKSAFEIVCLREECSPEPNALGTLVALSTNTEKLNNLESHYDYELANINSPSQLVVAVPQKTLKGFLHFLRRQRIAAKELKTVARPYHSSMLSPHRERFLKRLAELPFTIETFKYDFISSVTGRHYETGFHFDKTALIQLLSDQLTTPVQFVDQIQQLKNLGIFGFLELSSLAVLSDFIGKILPEDDDHHSIPFGDYLSKNDVRDSTSMQSFKVSDSQLLSGVVGFVSKITGYSIEEISINHRFEDDLRIDSIKKAEILFHSLEENKLDSETGLELSRLKYVGDLVEYIQKRKTQAPSGQKSLTSAFELCQEIWVPTAEASPQVKYNLKYDRLSAQALIAGSSLKEKNLVIDLDEAETVQPLELAEAFFTILGASHIDQVLLLTRNETSLYKAFHAFLLSLRKEKTPLQVKSLICDQEPSEQQIQIELQNPLSGEVSYQQGTRRTKALNKLSKENHADLNLNKVLSIGGSSGILKHYLSQSPLLQNTELVFVGRSQVDSDKIREAISLFAPHFKEIHYISCDITDKVQVAQLIKQLQQLHFQPDLILDGSGSEVSRLYSEKSDQEKQIEYHSKTSGLQAVRDHWEALNISNYKYLQFNSITSRYGNGGQTIYGLGDGFSMAQDVSHLVWPAIHKLGMTENLGILQKLLSMGVDLLPKEKVVPFLDECIAYCLSKTEPQTIDIVSLRDRLILQLQNLNKDWLKDCLGDIDVHPNLAIGKVLDQETMPFLSDHIITGKCIAPGCYGFASMYLLAQIYFNQRPSVHNFRLKSLIPLEAGPVKTRVEPMFHTIEHLDLKVVSKMENYEASFHYEAPKPQRTYQEKLKPVYNMAIDDFYSNKYVYHGPSFQVLTKVQISEDGRCLARLSIASSPPLSNSELFDRTAKLMEGAFQTAGFLATWHDFISLVPTYVKKIENFNVPATDEFTFVTSELRRQSQPDQWVTDIFIINQQGQIFMKLTDVTGMRIKTYSDFPVSHTNISEQEDQWIAMS